jgi:hypothetical protein
LQQIKQNSHRGYRSLEGEVSDEIETEEIPQNFIVTRIKGKYGQRKHTEEDAQKMMI